MQEQKYDEELVQAETLMTTKGQTRMTMSAKSRAGILEAKDHKYKVAGTIRDYVMGQTALTESQLPCKFLAGISAELTAWEFDLTGSSLPSSCGPCHMLFSNIACN